MRRRATAWREPVERVKRLLGRLDAVHVSRERGSGVSGEGERLFYKFVEQVAAIFDCLPRPVEWRNESQRPRVVATRAR